MQILGMSQSRTRPPILESGGVPLVDHLGTTHCTVSGKTMPPLHYGTPEQPQELERKVALELLSGHLNGLCHFLPAPLWCFQQGLGQQRTAIGTELDTNSAVKIPVLGRDILSRS